MADGIPESGAVDYLSGAALRGALDGSGLLKLTLTGSVTTRKDDGFLNGVARTSDGSIKVTIAGLVSVPAPPGSGTYKLRSTDGTLSWVVDA